MGALFYLTFGLFTTSGIILCMCTILMSNGRQRSIYDIYILIGVEWFMYYILGLTLGELKSSLSK